MKLIRVPTRRDYITPLLCILTIFTNGCTEDKDSSSYTAKPQTSFFITSGKIKTKTNTNISEYVSETSNSPITLTQIRSIDKRCEYQVEDQLEFSAFSHKAGLCLLEYTVNNKQQSSTQSAISVSSNSGEIGYLPQLNKSIHVNDGAVITDIIYELESLTGSDYSQYDVMPDTTVIGSGTALVSNNDITFTPSDYGEATVFYTLQNSSNKEVAVGSLVFAVSDSNQAPSARDLKYPTPISYGQKQTIDIGQLKDTNGTPIVSSPDGDSLYLTSVMSLEANAALSPATGPLSFTLQVPNGAGKVQDITYIVNDKKGGYASGIIRFEMGPPAPSFILNDTGLDSCTTETGSDRNLDCKLKDHNGEAIPAPQDGHIGRDALNREGKLQKKGAGPAGFDFTKIDSKGHELPDNAANWSCVRDNLTGRLWEVKTSDGTIQDVSQTFTWYNSDPKLNGGLPGTENGGNCTGSTACDTEKYIQHLNNTALCGYTDWRLPAKNELMSVFDYGRDLNVHDTLLSPDYFNAPYKFYVWTDESLGGTSKDKAIYVSPSHNDFIPKQKTDQYGVMAVAGTPYNDFTRPDRYKFSPDGTVSDTVTGLMWARCPSGKTWNGSSCQGNAAHLTWYQHIEAANNSQLAGYNDWRLPSIKELYSISDIVPGEINQQKIPPTSFYNELLDRYAVSTIGPLDASKIAVIYANGLVNFAALPKSYSSYALYCRDGS